jgi:hypothetical protein
MALALGSELVAHLHCLRAFKQGWGAARQDDAAWLNSFQSRMHSLRQGLTSEFVLARHPANCLGLGCRGECCANGWYRGCHLSTSVGDDVSAGARGNPCGSCVICRVVTPRAASTCSANSKE